MNVAIVGSREYPNLKDVADFVRTLPYDTVVVSGGAPGVDTWAETAARQLGLQVVVFRADWRKFGKRAGILRNYDIVMNADRVVAFWDGRSPGTKNTIAQALAHNKSLTLFVEKKYRGPVVQWQDAALSRR